MVAGPSEIGIIADGNANPDEVTADLLSQAEHDRRARAMLVTDSVELAEAVSAAVDQQLKPCRVRKLPKKRSPTVASLP